VVELRQRVLALHMAEGALPVLLADDLAQCAPRSRPSPCADRNGPHLAVARKAGAELELLDAET